MAHLFADEKHGLQARISSWTSPSGRAVVTPAAVFEFMGEIIDAVVPALATDIFR
jgi:hypothetical protein